MKIKKEQFSLRLSIHYERSEFHYSLRGLKDFVPCYTVSYSYLLFPLHSSHPGLLAAPWAYQGTLPPKAICALAVPADRILFAHLSICLNLSFSSDLYSNVPFSMMLSLLTLYKWPGCLLPLTSNIIYSALLFSFLIAPTSCEIVNDLFAGYFCLSLRGRGERGRNPVLILFYSLIYPR